MSERTLSMGCVQQRRRALLTPTPTTDAEAAPTCSEVCSDATQPQAPATPHAPAAVSHQNTEQIRQLCVLLNRMYCPKCGSQNGDEVIYCRGCGIDLASVRTIVEASAGRVIASPKMQLSERQLRRMRRRGLDGSEAPLTLAERAIEMQSSALRGLMLSGGFAFITYLVYQSPPVGGIFWLLPLAFTFFFFSATLSRFVQAGMIKKLLRESAPPAALPDTQPDYIQPPRSIYETDDLQPRSVTDATTRHLR